MVNPWSHRGPPTNSVGCKTNKKTGMWNRDLEGRGSVDRDKEEDQGGCGVREIRLYNIHVQHYQGILKV